MDTICSDRRDAVLLTCTKCGTKHTVGGWAGLRFVGIQRDAPGYPSLELRDCGCGTTLATEVPENTPSRPPEPVREKKEST